MRIFSYKALREFSEVHPDAGGALRAWYELVEKARWKTPAELKQQIRSASLVGDDLVIFNICGNRYRLVVRFNFEKQRVFIRFVGTHEAYDKLHLKTL